VARGTGELGRKLKNFRISARNVPSSLGWSHLVVNQLCNYLNLLVLGWNELMLKTAHNPQISVQVQNAPFAERWLG